MSISQLRGPLSIRSMILIRLRSGILSELVGILRRSVELTPKLWLKDISLTCRTLWRISCPFLFSELDWRPYTIIDNFYYELILATDVIDPALERLAFCRSPRLCGRAAYLHGLGEHETTASIHTICSSHCLLTSTASPDSGASMLLPSLTHLHVENCKLGELEWFDTTPNLKVSSFVFKDERIGPDSPSTQVPLPTLFNVLKSSPELTTLRLDMVIAPGSSDRNSEAVRLPLLDFLHIRDSLAYCEDVLVHLIFPATTRVEVYPQGITSGVDIRDILVPLRKISVLAAPIPTTLSIRVPRSNQENISHFSTATYLEPTLPAGLSCEKLFGINSHPDYARVLRQIMTKVLKTLASQEITQLDAGSAHLTGRTSAKQCWTPRLLALLTHHDPDEDPVDPFLDVLKRLLRAYRARWTPLIHLRLKDWFSNVNLNEAKWLELGDLVVHFELELCP
ncbi:hypothetical protein C8R44DRAFT_895811 [Mycena epipterygia]|nr:hypothetical protein C8R44DRAFT_895811 [Mycena epipterygia]